MNNLTIDNKPIEQGQANSKVAPYVNSAFKAALHCKCPKCRTGNMFNGGLLNPKMNINCPHCGFKFEIEPGYFYVAMFISYAINVAILVSSGIATFIITGSENPWLYLATTLIPTLVLSPFTYIYSRVILLFWLTPGIHFDLKRM